MKKLNTIKFLIIIFISNLVESFIAPYLYSFYVSFPLTFFIYLAVIYNFNKNINPIFSFLFGLYVDLISANPFGLNAGLFTLITYVINSYANSFKLYSFIQISILFGMSSVFYIGLKNLIINLENFSYLLLLISFLFNTTVFLLLTFFRHYSPKIHIRHD